MSGSWVLAGTVIGEAVIAVLLTGVVLWRYSHGHQRCHLYWGIGLALVAVTMAQEGAFYLGLWSEWFAQTYLVLVALLVGILSLGSAELSLKGWGRRLWWGYMGVTGAALVVVSFLSTVPSSIVVDGVVTGLPPIGIVVISSLVTFPASLLLIGSSLYGAIWQKRYHLLFIAVGTAVIAAAGSLYLVSFPLSLYYAEFVGVVLLFLGFVRVPGLSSYATPTPAV